MTDDLRTVADLLSDGSLDWVLECVAVTVVERETVHSPLSERVAERDDDPETVAVSDRFIRDAV